MVLPGGSGHLHKLLSPPREHSLSVSVDFISSFRIWLKHHVSKIALREGLIGNAGSFCKQPSHQSASVVNKHLSLTCCLVKRWFCVFLVYSSIPRGEDCWSKSSTNIWNNEQIPRTYGVWCDGNWSLWSRSCLSVQAHCIYPPG